VSDPAKSGEASSGVKSVTINGVEQKADSTYYSLPAPDGGNNDAGAEYTVVATDNAGNASTATVKIYRRHRVRVVSPDEQTTYAEAELAYKRVSGAHDEDAGWCGGKNDRQGRSFGNSI